MGCNKINFKMSYRNVTLENEFNVIKVCWFKINIRRPHNELFMTQF